jgi:hypothetical protein
VESVAVNLENDAVIGPHEIDRGSQRF